MGPFEASRVQDRTHLRSSAGAFLLFGPKSIRLTSRPPRTSQIVPPCVQLPWASKHAIILRCSPDGGTGVCPAAQRSPAAAAEPERSPPPLPRPSPVGG